MSPLTRLQPLAVLLLGLLISPSSVGPHNQSPAFSALPGQSSTLLPDGRWLLLGVVGSDGRLGTATIVDPRTGTRSGFPALQHPRAWHTATVLPDGSVLVFGGIDTAGQTLTAPEVFDPDTQSVVPGSASTLTARARHSATVLTDGRVLLAGGTGSDGQTLGHTELWHPKTGRVESVVMITPRSGHAATLEPDGMVLLSGGIDAVGTPLGAGELFDPDSLEFKSATAIARPTGPVRLEASIPADGETDVSLDSVVALRFSTPVRVETLSEGTITLSSPAGAEPARIVAAEAGRLAFINPVNPLSPGRRYTIAINGAEDPDGVLLPLTQVGFTTVPATTSIAAAAGAGRARPHQHHPAVASAQPGTASETDEPEWTGERRDGKPHSPWQDMPPLQAPHGVTALAGQVLRLNGDALPGVTLRIGSRSARSDYTGRFLLTHIDAGPQELLMDGSTANRPGRTYGTFDYEVGIVGGRTNVLPFTIWMPLLDMQHATSIPVPTATEVVATTPLIPGLEVHIPANVVLRTEAGGPLTVLSLTRIPVDRPPFPLPPGTTFFFTPQGHGASVQGPNGMPSAIGVRLVLPNPDGLPPATRLALKSYDYDHGGWYEYGWGTVSADGRQIVPDPGVEFHRLTCAFPLGNPLTFIAPVLDGIQEGDPVDLATGLATITKVDLVLPDVIPLVIERKFRPSGVGGWTFFNFQIYLVGDATTFGYADLVLADGAKVHYVRTSPGTDKQSAVMEHTATPTRFYKSTLAWNAARPGWDITFPSGTVYEMAPKGETGSWGTDPGPLLTAVRDRAGNRLTITRDPFNTSLVRRITSPNGRWVDVTQDANRSFTQFRDNIGRTVTYTYDAYNRLTSVTDVAGGVTRYTYDAYNRLSTIQDPRGIVYMSNQYDGHTNARVVSQTQADGTTYQFVYTLDANGHVTQTDVTDRRGNVRRVTFNASGYVLTDTRALGTPIARTTSYVRDATSNLVTSVTDALGRRTDYARDPMGNVLTVTRLAGTADAVTTSLTYEPTFNQVTSVTDPLSHTTSLGYDAAGNPTSLTDPSGHQTTLTYNGSGQPITITTPAGTTRLGYDGGDLATITDPMGQTSTRFSDGAGRIVGVTNPLGQRTRYDYDSGNRLTRTTDSLGGLTQFGYDANGNLLTLTDARNSVTRYLYDDMDRQTDRADPLAHRDTYGYDAGGNLASVTDRKGQVTTRSYDSLDRLSTVAYGDGSTTSYTWDAGDRLVQLADSLSGTITRTYDGLDRLTQETTPQGTITYTYDSAGRRASMTVAGQPAVTYTYDDADRLIDITQAGNTVTFGYDSANRRTRLTLSNGVATQYTYDAASRLTRLTYLNAESVIGTLTYSYDASGNRTTMGGTWAATGLPQALASATYDAANRQLAFGILTLAYDSNGNLTSDGTNTYTWDARNRLVHITGGTSADFGYDGLGRRQQKVVDTTAAQFLYDGLNPIQELAGPTSPANLLVGLGADMYLARTDAAGARFFLVDALASTLALTDSTGSVMTRYIFEPFGATTVTGAATDNPFAYTGRENDVTGLYYYRARYYHPTLQRFISEDPIGFRGGASNLYIYALNNPIELKDPSGLDVTITLYRGLGMNVFNHIGVGVNTNSTFGLYEAQPSMAIYLGLDTPGIVKPDLGHVLLDTITIQSDAVQDALMQAVITKAIAHPPMYNLYGRNCSSFVRDVLSAGGIQVPDTTFPNILMDALKSRYGDRTAMPVPSSAAEAALP